MVRAFVSNPEIVCFHKPFQLFDGTMVLSLSNIVKEFVAERGLGQDSARIAMRRPRTCIVTRADALHVDLADVIFHMSREEGIRRIDAAEATTVCGVGRKGSNNDRPNQLLPDGRRETPWH